MLTYNGVTYHEDEEAHIVYFFNESRMEFCKNCPMQGKDGVLKVDENTTIASVYGCPCETLRTVASASISMDAYKAIRDVGAFDALIEEIKKQDMPVGGSCLATP